MIRLAVAVLIPFLLPLTGAGCASAPSHPQLPTVTYDGAEEAARIVADRADAVKAVSSEGNMTLRRPDGESVRFDIALVRDDAGRMRLRAWKLGRAVLDLTVNDDGVWLLAPDDASLKQKVRSAGVSARQLAETWGLFSSGDLFRTPDRVFRRYRGGPWLLEVPRGDGSVQALVDVRTLAPTTFVLTQGGRIRFTLNLSEYRMVGDLPFARRYRATSDEGEIDIRLRDVDLNTELAAAAFKPPRRAEKLP